MAREIAELAEFAEVSTNIVVRFERGGEVKRSTVDQLQNALQPAGIEFIPENGGGVGSLRQEHRRQMNSHHDRAGSAQRASASASARLARLRQTILLFVIPAQP
jgi:hypothetical protein